MTTRKNQFTVRFALICATSPRNATGCATNLTYLGVYMYIETTGRKPGDKAWLVSPTLQPKVNECLRFYYHMSGTDIGQLNVNIRESGTKNITRLWNLAGSRMKEWVQASLPLNFSKPSEVRLLGYAQSQLNGEQEIIENKIANKMCKNSEKGKCLELGSWLCLDNI
jgi:hypothetical protein